MDDRKVWDVIPSVLRLLRAVRHGAKRRLKEEMKSSAKQEPKTELNLEEVGCIEREMEEVTRGARFGCVSPSFYSWLR